MKPRLDRLFRHGRTLLAAAVLTALTGACGREPDGGWQGYAEGDFLYLAAPRAGRLARLDVARGTTVGAGEPLFALDPEPEAAALGEARQRLQQARERRADLGKGQRPSELAALDALRSQAEAGRQLAATELARRERLFSDQIIPREQLDQARTALTRAEGAVAELDAQLRTAQLGARSNAQRGADAEIAAAEEQVAQARWALDEKSQLAPAAGLVFDTLFRPGEFVPAGRPVVVLLPPENLKVRFYIPEPELAGVRIGDPVRLTADGGEPIAATVSFISPQAEFTPPVIFSRETRSKLVFLIEARPHPGQATRLHPGQPLSVQAEGRR